MKISSPGYSLRWHCRSVDIGDDVWRATMPASAEGRWWYAALEAGGINEQFEWWFGELLAAHNRPVGIVPAFVMNVPMELVAPPEAMRLIRALGPLGRPFLTQRTLFVGNVAGEGGHLGLATDIDPAPALKAIERHVWRLRRKVGAKLVVWKDFERTTSAALWQTLQPAGYFRLASFPATTIDLPTASTAPARPTPDAAVEVYLKALPQDYRYKLRKKLKASRADVPLTTSVLTTPTPEEMSDIWGLFQQTYHRGKTKFENFGPAVFDQFARHPDARWLLLRRADTSAAVAFMLLTREPAHWVNRFIGLDYAAPKELFLYYRLFLAAIEVCSADPRPHLLSGQTGYRAKLELGHSLIPLDNFARHRNPLLHRVYAKVGREVTWSSLDEELAVFLKAHPELDGTKPASP